MNKAQKRLAYIILDVVAIIAILGIVLLDDMSRDYEKNAFQKLITGEVQWADDQVCSVIRCGDLPATYAGEDQFGLSICKCKDGRAYSIMPHNAP
jgi:hypothetical protein